MSLRLSRTPIAADWPGFLGGLALALASWGILASPRWSWWSAPRYRVCQPCQLWSLILLCAKVGGGIKASYTRIVVTRGSARRPPLAYRWHVYSLHFPHSDVILFSRRVPLGSLGQCRNSSTESALGWARAGSGQQPASVAGWRRGCWGVGYYFL